MVTSFLASFCNSRRAGTPFPLGLFAIDSDGAPTFRGFIDLDLTPDDRPIAGATGLCRHNHSVCVAIQTDPSSIVLLGSDGEPELIPTSSVRRLHSMLSSGSELLLVSTGTDCLVSLEPRTRDENVVHRLADGNSNTLHLNGIASHRGAILVSMMGPDQSDRGRVRTGEVRNLATGKPMIRGMREPHSIVSMGDELFVLESMTAQLIALRNRKAAVDATFAGYVRGLHMDSGLTLVGRSVFRDRSASQGQDRKAPPGLQGDQATEATRSAIYASIAGGPWTSIETTHIAPEIYDFLVLTEAESSWISRWLVPAD